MLRLTLLFTLFLMTGCESLVALIEGDEYHHKINSESKSQDFSVVFSHNINGETEPCGCRHFPRGGLAGVATALKQTRDKKPVIYVDTGDMLFPSKNVPDTVRKSLTYTAKNLFKAADLLDLKYFVPGEKDFALGTDFLKNLSQTVKFKFLVSNAKESFPIKHLKFAKVKAGEKNLIFLGIMDPKHFTTSIHRDLLDPEKVLTEIAKTLELSTKKKPQDFVILLSHSGMDRDKVFAKKFPWIDWIIGAHSQNFTQRPEEVGQTKIVQVLGRNHYMGNISIPWAAKADLEKYATLEIAEDLKDKWKENPLLAFMEKHRTELREIQISEQSGLSVPMAGDETLTPFTSCLDCHQDQGKKWFSTAHSSAYYTLVQEKSEHDQNCIACHSVGFKNPKGFQTTSKVIQNAKGEMPAGYLKELKQAFKGVKSLRGLSDSRRIALKEQWNQLDKKYEIEKHFASVQCLNCHDQSTQHPYEMNAEEVDIQKRAEAIKMRCLACHTPDQSPGWYESDKADATLKEKVFAQHYQNIACPKQME